MELKYKNLLSNSAWTIIGNAGGKLLNFLMLPLYTRLLGTAGFGETDLVLTYSSILMYVLTVCISESIFVFTKKEDEDRKKVFFTTSFLFVLLLLIAWTCIWFLLGIVIDNNDIHNSFTDNFWLILGVIVSTFFQQYTQQFILSLNKIKLYSTTGIIQCLLTALLSYFLIISMGVRGYIWAIIAANSLTTIYTFVLSKLYNYLCISLFDSVCLRELLRYSIPLIPNGIMWWLVSAMNRPIMEHNLDYSAIGIFAVANRFPSVVTMVFAVFSVAWNVSVFEEFGNDSFKFFYRKVFNVLFLFLLFISCGMITSSEIVISIFASTEFYDAWKYMIVLIISAFFSCLSSFFGTNFGVVKKSKYFFYSSLWGASSSIILNILLISKYVLWADSFSVLIFFFVMSFSIFFFNKFFI